MQTRAQPKSEAILYSIAIAVLVSLLTGCSAVNTFVVLLPEEGEPRLELIQNAFELSQPYIY